jgi:hypothetical protein
VSAILAAALVSAVVGAAAWLIAFLFAGLFLSGVFFIPYAVPFLMAPLIGGLAGGLVSRRFVGLAGSFAGNVVVLPVLGVVVFGWTLSLNGLAQVAVVIGVLATAGHLTGVLIRPTRIGSSVTP